ncbi:MAG: cell wall protein [Myxococcaceae bacterium]
MSVDKAFREMISAEVEQQLKSFQTAIARDLGALRALAERLGPIAGLLGGSSLALRRRGPGRPPGSGRKPAVRRGRRTRLPAGGACAIIGCKRPSRTKGYCSAHYQKLRMLTRSNRRPAEWKDYASPQSVTDLVLPRGRAAHKKKESSGS